MQAPEDDDPLALRGQHLRGVLDELHALVADLSPPDSYPVQFGEGEEFYVQWCSGSVRAPGGPVCWGRGWKQAIIGEGDRRASPAYSCTQLEIVTQNTYQRGFPQLYHSCGGKDGRYEPLEEPLLPSDSKLQNAIPGPVLYLSLPRCHRAWADKPNQWMTFQVHVQVGTWYKNDRHDHQDSTIQLWVAEEGQPSQLVIRRSGLRHRKREPGCEDGKVWLSPYHTGKDPAQAHAVGHVLVR